MLIRTHGTETTTNINTKNTYTKNFAPLSTRMSHKLNKPTLIADDFSNAIEKDAAASESESVSGIESADMFLRAQHTFNDHIPREA